MVFFSFRTFFRTTQELEFLFYFCRAKHTFFFQNLTLGYMTKTLNQIFFPLHQNQNIFFSNIGNQNIFFRKNRNPLPFKLNGRSLICICRVFCALFKHPCPSCFGFCALSIYFEIFAPCFLPQYFSQV